MGKIVMLEDDLFFTNLCVFRHSFVTILFYTVLRDKESDR